MAQQLNFVVLFIVQDSESKCFLMPEDGDVGFTSWAHEAGRFADYGEAVDTAELHCYEGFHVTKVVDQAASFISG